METFSEENLIEISHKPQAHDYSFLDDFAKEKKKPRITLLLDIANTQEQFKSPFPESL